MTTSRGPVLGAGLTCRFYLPPRQPARPADRHIDLGHVRWGPSAAPPPTFDWPGMERHVPVSAHRACRQANGMSQPDRRATSPEFRVGVSAPAGGRPRIDGLPSRNHASCMVAQTRKQYQEPTEQQVVEARRVLVAMRQARLRARRRARRSLTPGTLVYPTSAFLCGHCGVPFEGRRGNYGRVRYCSASCRTMAYQERQRRAERLGA